MSIRILIVEDEPTSAIIIEKAIGSDIDAQTVVSGSEAVEHFRKSLEEERPYTLIFLDIMIPEIPGIEVLKKIRELEELFGQEKKATVIMTTSLKDAHVVVEAFKNGCEAYVTKPLNKHRLQEELRRAGVKLPES